jgi:hypothetical protein
VITVIHSHFDQAEVMDRILLDAKVCRFALAFLGGFGLNTITSGFSAFISRFKAGMS